MTRGIAEQAFSEFAPGQLIELHPDTIYYAIVRAARVERSPASIAAALRAAYAEGKL